MRIERALMNPLISPLHVTPSSPEMQVVSAFNAAATTWKGETILLLRVAEIPRDVPDEEVAVPIVERSNGKVHVSIRRFRKGTPGLNISDPRAVIFDGEILPSSLSHLRLARSQYGFHFDIDCQPAIFPTEDYEEYGIEDPRMTVLEGVVYINYTPFRVSASASRWPRPPTSKPIRNMGSFSRRRIKTSSFSPSASMASMS